MFYKSTKNRFYIALTLLLSSYTIQISSMIEESATHITAENIEKAKEIDKSYAFPSCDARYYTSGKHFFPVAISTFALVGYLAKQHLAEKNKIAFILNKQDMLRIVSTAGLAAAMFENRKGEGESTRFSNFRGYTVKQLFTTLWLATNLWDLRHTVKTNLDEAKNITGACSLFEPILSSLGTYSLLKNLAASTNEDLSSLTGDALGSEDDQERLGTLTKLVALEKKRLAELVEKAALAKKELAGLVKESEKAAKLAEPVEGSKEASLAEEKQAEPVEGSKEASLAEEKQAEPVEGSEEAALAEERLNKELEAQKKEVEAALANLKNFKTGLLEEKSGAYVLGSRVALQPFSIATAIVSGLLFHYKFLQKSPRDAIIATAKLAGMITLATAQFRDMPMQQAVASVVAGILLYDASKAFLSNHKNFEGSQLREFTLKDLFEKVEKLGILQTVVKTLSSEIIDQILDREPKKSNKAQNIRENLTQSAEEIARFLEKVLEKETKEKEALKEDMKSFNEAMEMIIADPEEKIEFHNNQGNYFALMSQDYYEKLLENAKESSRQQMIRAESPSHEEVE